MTWLFLLGALLAAAGWAIRRRRLETVEPELSDEQLRRIESFGRVDVDEPLDLREAADEEERFWNESWDQPEPW